MMCHEAIYSNCPQAAQKKPENSKTFNETKLREEKN